MYKRQGVRERGFDDRVCRGEPPALAEPGGIVGVQGHRGGHLRMRIDDRGHALDALDIAGNVDDPCLLYTSRCV